jgi:hypothetical protein
MTKSDPPDLAEEIIRFIESMPTTIRADILVFVLMYAADEASMESETFLPKIRETLTKAGGMKRMGATLRTIAALDYLLPRAAKNIRRAKFLIENSPQLKQELVDRFSAGQPLRQRHYDVALANWKRLRTTLITHQSLSEYEDILLTPRHLKRDT